MLPSSASPWSLVNRHLTYFSLSEFLSGIYGCRKKKIKIQASDSSWVFIGSKCRISNSSQSVVFFLSSHDFFPSLTNDISTSGVGHASRGRFSYSARTVCASWRLASPQLLAGSHRHAALCIRSRTLGSPDPTQSWGNVLTQQGVQQRCPAGDEDWENWENWALS